LILTIISAIAAGIMVAIEIPAAMSVGRYGSSKGVSQAGRHIKIYVDFSQNSIFKPICLKHRKRVWKLKHIK